jgi:uncharacterized protein with GYD domain
VPKYLLEVNYSVEGVKGVLKEGGSSRRSVVEELVKGMGGKLESFYYAFGKDDVYVIVEMPDDESVAAVSLAVGAAGGASIVTTVLVEPETIDAAAKRSVGYRPPGK